MKQVRIQKTINDSNAPIRLQGLVVELIIDPSLKEKQIRCEISMPKNPTKQEQGYFRLFASEMVEELENETGVELEKATEFSLCPKNYRLADELFDKNKYSWLDTQLASLGGKKPKDLCDDELHDLLLRIKDGSF